MSATTNTKPSPKSIKESQAMWDNFVAISKICGVAIAVTLILMAMFLV